MKRVILASTRSEGFCFDYEQGYQAIKQGMYNYKKHATQIVTSLLPEFIDAEGCVLTDTADKLYDYCLDNYDDLYKYVSSGLESPDLRTIYLITIINKCIRDYCKSNQIPLDTAPPKPDTFFDYVSIDEVEEQLDMTSTFDHVESQVTDVDVENRSAVAHITYVDGRVEDIAVKFAVANNNPHAAFESLSRASNKVFNRVSNHR